MPVKDSLLTSDAEQSINSLRHNKSLIYLYADNGISTILVNWLDISLVDHTLMIVEKIE